MANSIEQSPGEDGAAGSRGRGRIRAAFLVLTAIVALGVTAGSAYGFYLYKYVDGTIVHVPPPEGQTSGEAHVGGPCLRNACNYLVMGNDSRKGLSKAQQSQFGSSKTVKGRRSDTIMLVRVDPRLEKATVLSFPRDLWVRIPRHGFGKITSAYEGGPYRVADVVHRLTGLRINHFLSVNLAGFQRVVDAIGGVHLCVDRPLVDPLSGLDLPHAGCYDLDGFQALAFVRARHTACDFIPDFARIGRQQQFLRAILAKILQPSMIPRAPSIVRAVAPNLQVDPDFDFADLLYLVNKLKGISTGAVDFRAVPSVTATTETSAGTVDIVSLKQPYAGELFRRLREGEPLGALGKHLQGTPPSPANVAVQVLDASSGGRAAGVLRFLTRSGFDVGSSVSPAPAKLTESAILFREGADAGAGVVRGYLPSLPLRQVGRSILGDSSVGVVVTADYAGPGVGGPTPSPSSSPNGSPGSCS